ncbi:proteasome maturation factor UMP1 [Conidiobolus coronatus NRRL 28638]|uniref:Proteasome maturation factor UMP1 n=1 Tax=Conidiobolus coronatus (strain ATCC 28846 / CBS 209.66 / NRRL 28638) TaxID=796925 RepID=A0A137NZ79_CONC2|nr:proteasome maturation factor UMP1 [Conidiobolus coronatus NRRL 28638]|eukprot:KXN68133.1 proteasome maturation factor UMP1 [Conidiobolus coronatus NRRL 28638]
MSHYLGLQLDSTENTTIQKSLEQTSNEYGVHDSMRFGLKSVASEIVQGHPLEKRLENFDKTQLQLKLNMRRQTAGLHSPFRTLMEVDALSRVKRPSNLPSSNFGLDILLGRDETLEVEDFLNTGEIERSQMDFHNAMENQLGFNC